MVVETHSRKPAVATLLIAAALAFAAVVPAIAQSGGPDDARIDELFAQLQEAEEGRAGRIERQIYEAWSKSGSPAMDLLLKRGRDALDAGDPQAALDHFSALVDHAPDFAEGYNGRATAYYLLDMYGQAIDDIREVLIRNPRHIGAMQGFSVMLEELGREAEALEVLRMVRALHPQAPQVEAAVERLELKLHGQSL